MKIVRTRRRFRPSIVLVFALGLGAAVVATALAYSNTNAITINDAMFPPTPASLYPSDITVPSLGGSITKVTVTITGVSHTFPDDIDMLLVSPLGPKMEIWSDACGGNPGISNLTITLDDAAAVALPDAAGCVSTSYRPADYVTAQDAFATGAPAGPYLAPEPTGTDTLAAFNSAMPPTGTWSLYIVDDLSGDGGSISGGWAINFAGPTGVNIKAFVARPAHSGVALTWRTVSETQVAGFNVYRSGTGRTVRVNERLIPAKSAGTTRGATYRLIDPAAKRGASYTYRLETVGLNGSRSSGSFTTVIW